MGDGLHGWNSPLRSPDDILLCRAVLFALLSRELCSRKATETIVANEEPLHRNHLEGSGLFGSVYVSGEVERSF